MDDHDFFCLEYHRILNIGNHLTLCLTTEVSVVLLHGDRHTQPAELTSVHKVKQDFFNMKESKGCYSCVERVEHQK